MGQCLKCGKKTEERSVFCGGCLAVMEQYPVKPGTVVHLPQRQTVSEANTPGDYDESTTAAQLVQQRGMIRWLTGIIAALSVLLVITAVLLIHSLDNGPELPVIGRNYTTNTTAPKP